MTVSRTFALFALLSSVTACLEVEPGEITIDDEPIEAVDQLDDALISVGHWQADLQQSVDLGSASDRFCFFTRIAGNFRGSGEHMQLAVQNGRWILSGRSGQAALNSEAQCVGYAEFSSFGADRSLSIPAGWSVIDRLGPRYKNMWATNSSLCWLSAIGGALNGASNGLNVSRGSSTWSVDAWAYVDAPQPVEGAGMCTYLGANKGYFPAGSSTGFHYWKQGDPYTRMAPAQNAVCWLTAVHGNFRSANETVSIRKLSDGYYWLMGASSSDGVSASAFCVSKQLTTVIAF